MTRRAPLPKITECVEKQKAATDWISAGRLVRAVYPFAVICALCLAHINLEFQRSDMLMQQGRLQQQHRQLVRQQGFLDRQNESLCNPASLRDRARRDLNMQEIDATGKELIATVPKELMAKYTAPGKPDRGAVMVAQLREERETRGIGNMLMSILDVNRANASSASND
jgi:cell division protein FtsL